MNLTLITIRASPPIPTRCWHICCCTFAENTDTSCATIARISSSRPECHMIDLRGHGYSSSATYFAYGVCCAYPGKSKTRPRRAAKRGVFWNNHPCHPTCSTLHPHRAWCISSSSTCVNGSSRLSCPMMPARCCSIGAFPPKRFKIALWKGIQ